MYIDSFVSVIIATNRESRFLQRAVTSVLQQSVPVGEIILVDDGAPVDLTPFARVNGLRFHRQQATGVSAARNAGAGRARGSWLAFLDDDDEWSPVWLEHQLSAVSQSRCPIAAAFTGGWHMDADGAPFGDLLSGAPVDRRDMLSGRVALPRLGAMLIRHEAFDRVGGFRVGLARAEDDDLIFRLLERGEFVGTDKPLWGYRRHSDNVTNDRLNGIQGNIACARLLLREARGRDDELVILYKEQLSRARQRAASDAVGLVVDAARR